MLPPSSSPAQPDPEPLTTLHVRRAVDGDSNSVAWLVDRLNPLLIAQASWRLGAHGSRVHDPADIVQDAWIVLLSRFGTLVPQQGRLTPVLLSFLSSTILLKVQNLLRREARRRMLGDRSGEAASEPSHADPIDPNSGVVTRAVRSESRSQVADVLEELADADREVILMRGVEQQDTAEVARRLGVSEKAASKRYSRALQRLRARLPDSVFGELSDE